MHEYSVVSEDAFCHKSRKYFNTISGINKKKNAFTIEKSRLSCVSSVPTAARVLCPGNTTKDRTLRAVAHSSERVHFNGIGIAVWYSQKLDCWGCDVAAVDVEKFAVYTTSGECLFLSRCILTFLIWSRTSVCKTS